MKQLLRKCRILADNSAATAIEYALIGVLVSVAAVGIMALLGDNLENGFENTAEKVVDAHSGVQGD